MTDYDFSFKIRLSYVITPAKIYRIYLKELGVEKKMSEEKTEQGVICFSAFTIIAILIALYCAVNHMFGIIGITYFNTVLIFILIVILMLKSSGEKGGLKNEKN